MESNIGLTLESSEDNGEDSEEKNTDLGICFAILKNRGFSHQEILNLSYPQFNAYMKNINNPITYGITIPYMGSGEEKEEQISSKEEFLNLVADMNKDFL
jgi:hypothetical protein